MTRHRRTWRGGTLVALCGLAVLGTASDARAGRAHAPLQLHTKGTQILSSKNQPVTLGGVIAAGTRRMSGGEGPAPAPAQTPAAAQAGGDTPRPRPVYRNYALGPDSLVHDDVPHGKLEGPFLYKSSILENTVRKYWVYVPAQYKPKKAACVVVFQDGARAINPSGVLRVPNVMDNLIARREMPVSIGIFITPGQRGDTFPDAIGFGNPDNRSVEYDSMNDAYARFIVDEMLPLVGKSYNLTKNPDGRCIGGASSGGIAAFSVAWYRPDAFRKVISMIGSFTDIRGGHVYPELVRSGDKKPIRIFLQDGIYDNRNPENPRRDWHLQNELMLAALQEKGYDTQYVVGEAGHSDNHGGAILPDMLRWMWRDYPR